MPTSTPSPGASDSVRFPSRTLAMQVAALIIRRIDEGTLGPHLPGELELARDYDISRPTMRATLQQLEKQGYLEPARKGCRRRVNEDRVGQSPQKMTVRFLAARPLHEMPAGSQASMQQIRLRLLSHGLEMSFHVSSAFQARRVERILAHDVEGVDCGAWVITDATPAIEKWFAARPIPSVFVGGSYEHQLPRTGGDGDKAISDAAQLLLSAGHQRIVFLLRNSYGVQMLAPFRHTLEANGIQWDERLHMLRWRDAAENLYPRLERLMATPHPPTAFITLGILSFFPLVSWCAAQGLRYPKDYSLVHILDDPMLYHYHPPVTRFIHNRENLCHALVSLIVRAVESAQPFDEARMIPMTLLPGRSVGPPPGHRP